MQDDTRDRWLQSDTLFRKLLDLPPEERVPCLDKVCRDDPDLRREVERLLDALAASDDFLDDPADWIEVPFITHLNDPLGVEGEDNSGERIGAYRLVKQVGHGGMGTVYLAERVDGAFQQRVALKLLRRGMTRRQEAQRFRAERQILARLQHPGIAHLLDGGMTPGSGPGQAEHPYLVMEYVEGVPIDQYGDAQRLGIDARLALVQQVCRAVQYAHQNLIIHRDLKPSNILVTEAGQVKLLDFGIAKVLDGAALSFTQPITVEAQRLMTPAYAAPEQVTGEAVTTATDVYALGVLLYRLLTGQAPYELSGHPQREIERRIVEMEPPLPSQVAGQTASPQHLSWRQPEALRRRLSGDLDNIVLKALRKAPEERYGTVAELAEDLRRHQKGLPVEARPATVGYRLRKFVGRHRMGVATTVAVVVLAVGFGVFHTMQITAERDAKELEATRASEMLDFTVGLFDVVDPQQAQGATVTAEDLIETGLQRLEALADQPERQAAMLDVMGRVSFSVSQYARADSLFRRAIALKERTLGPVQLSVAESLNQLGWALMMQDSLAAAEAQFERARMIQGTVLGAEDPDAMKYVNSLAFAYFTLGDGERAEVLLRDLLTRGDDPAWRDHPEMTEVRYTLARVLDFYGEHTEAEALFRTVLAQRVAEHGPAHSDAADVEFLLARNLVNQDRLDEAARRYQHAYDVYRRVYGEENWYAAMGIYALAQVQQRRAAYAEAEAGYREAARIYEIALPGSPWRAYALVALGQVRLEQNDPAEAERLFRQGLDLYAASSNPDVEQIAVAQSWLGRSLTEQGRYSAAESLLLDAYDTLSALDHLREKTNDTLHRLVALYQAWSRPDEAVRYETLLSEFSEAEGEAEE